MDDGDRPQDQEGLSWSSVGSIARRSDVARAFRPLRCTQKEPRGFPARAARS
jgi:hypothetical protein